MAVEIERKFLISSDEWRKDVSSSIPMVQGYLGGRNSTIRVRKSSEGAFLTIKGKASGLVRSEFEYPIPDGDASEILSSLCVDFPVEKIRHIIPAGNGLCWEIDEYLKENHGLFTAEIELPSPDTPFEKPAWLGEEISENKNYTNRSLSRAPYSTWVNGQPPNEDESK